ncbi:DUF1501 domain-containing protein [Solimonas sp. K1W22B-7]|uniref:DUF1501 domain-containing protein n=1 Tax=Solimonas sp. K1W22B-7 TaxID=2303331 RepID=UPI000E3374AD|nr:DUF1501 domain-containing protein [Solimonas sp. K1W22B-7]AXQ29937.1 DUF1501 domain-containing protein [Solimonas sp. K1W22B-7]
MPTNLLNKLLPATKPAAKPAAATTTTTAAAPARVAAASTAGGHTLVVVFQRFAADWINMLVPYGDPDYAVLRPNLKVTNPVVLDSFFGLNPGLNALKRLYDNGRLGFVTATGWVPLDSRDRSHFYAQTLAEAGARAGVIGGWLGRAMTRAPADSNVWSAIAAENAVPASLQGYPGAIAVRDFADLNHGSTGGIAVTALIEAVAELAGPPGDTTRRLAQGMRALVETPPPAPTVAYPATALGNGLRVAAQAIRAGMSPRVVTVNSEDDWDTHVVQASRHAISLPNFANALVAFHDDLGAMMDNVTVVTMTEFGRKAKENFGGTDHGTASSMLVMGGRVAGGRVHGRWPGLSPQALFQNEDLEPTTDFRSVLGEILAKRLGVSLADLELVFPGGYAAQGNWRQFLL